VTHPVLDRIGELGQLQDGWNFGEGLAPSPQVMAVATQLASKAFSLGFSELDAFPGKNGEVTVVIYLGKEDHSFQVKRDSSVRYWNESDPESEIEEGLSISETIQRINSLSKPPWNLFYLSTSDSGTRSGVVSAAKHSTIRATKAEYLSSNMILSYGVPSGASAYTLEDFTQQSPRSLQSSGSLTTRSCQPATR
jgi:hypothetical protein